MGHYSLGKVTPRWDYFRDHFKELSDIPMLIEFYTGMEKYYKSSPHTDRGRSVAINVPVEVDLQHSNAFFGKYFELDKYSHQQTLVMNLQLLQRKQIIKKK